MTQAILYKIVMLLVKVHDESAVRQVCRENLKIPENEIDAAIGQARQKLLESARFHIKEEYARALLSLFDMLTSSMKIKDYKVALQIRKELNRLLGLYDKDENNRQDAITPEAEELAQIRKHLHPLNLSDDDDVPTLELVRLVAYKVMQHDRQNITGVSKKKAGLGTSKPRKVAGRSGNSSHTAGKKLAKKKGVRT